LEQQLAENVLSCNLRQLRLQRISKELISKAQPSGTVVWLPDGSLALSTGDAVLGARPSSGHGNTAVETIGRADDSAVVVFGFGLGHTVREVRRRAHGPVVVFDPDPSVVRTALEFSPSDVGEVHVCCELDEFRATWPTLSRGKSGAVIVTTPGYRQCYPGAFDQLREALGTLQSSAKVSENTLHIRARSWVENMLTNLHRLEGTRPFGVLRRAFRDVPAFIVGAGPSAQRNAHLLAEATRKGIVFAVNSSASILAAHLAEPQVLVCLEAANHTNQLRDLPWIDRVNRALSLSASPATWEMAGGPVLPFFEDIHFFYELRMLYGVDGIAVAGSVSTAALSLAEMLGCSPIVFLGQDLAFTDGRVHAEGTEIEDSRVCVDRDAGRIVYDWCAPAHRIFGNVAGAPTGEQLSEVCAWGGGGTVVSSATWNLVRDWLEAKARSLGSGGTSPRLVNSTEGGSRIPGFEEIPLAEVLSTMPELLITSGSIREAAERRSAAVSAEAIQSWIDVQVDRTRAAASAAEELRAAVSAAIEAVGDEKPDGVSIAYDHVARTERVLRQAIGRQPLLDAWCQADIDDLVKPLQSAAEGSAVDDARRGLDTELCVARVVATAAGELGDRLERAK
jgi:hypothetical protein